MRSGKHRPAGDAAPLARSARSEEFAAAVRAGRHEELVDHAVQRMIAEIGARRSLDEEIGALRIVLQRVIAIDALDGDPERTALTVARLVDAISRATRVRRATSDELGDGLSQALTRVLTEMGLGDQASGPDDS